MTKLGIFKTIILLSYLCIASLSAAIITPGLHDIQIQFQLSSGALNWVVSIFLFGYVVGPLIYGPLSNRYGRLYALRLGLIINIIGILISIYASYYTLYDTLLIGRLITALGASSGLAITFTLIHELFPEDKVKHVLSFAVLAFTMGIGISVTVGGVITQYFAWYYCFYLLLIHGVIMLISTWQYKETLKQKQCLKLLHIANSYIKALKEPELIIFSLLISLTATFSYGYSAVAPLYAYKVLHLSPELYGYWNIINIIGMLASSFISSFLLRKFTVSKTIIILMIILVPFLVLLLTIAICNTASSMLFFITTMFLYLILGALMGPGTYLALKNSTDKSSSSSMMSFINMGTATCIISIMGYLPLRGIEQLSYIFIFIFIFIACLSSIYLYFKRESSTIMPQYVQQE